MEEQEKTPTKKKHPKFKRNLIISFLIGLGILIGWAIFLLYRNGWAILDAATFFSDDFALAGMCYIFAYAICLLSRTTFFARFGYFNQKRQAKRHKTMPKYKTMQQYLAARPEPSFDARLLWIPGAAFFAVALIFLIFTF